MKIAIIGSDNSQAAEIEQLICKSWIFEEKLQLWKATNSIEALQFINKSYPDIVALAAEIDNMSYSDFLDLPKYNHFQVVVFAKNKTCPHKTNKHNIAGFVQKPYTIKNVKRALSTAITKQNYLFAQTAKAGNTSNTIIYRGGGGGRSIDIEVVMYIEGHGDSSKTYTNDNRATKIGKRLNKLENLHPNLIRCHKSYIINTDYITEYIIADLRVELNDFVLIPVGPLYKNLVFPKFGI